MGTIDITVPDTGINSHILALAEQGENEQTIVEAVAGPYRDTPVFEIIKPEVQRRVRSRLNDKHLTLRQEVVEHVRKGKTAEKAVDAAIKGLERATFVQEIRPLLYAEARRVESNNRRSAEDRAFACDIPRPQKTKSKTTGRPAPKKMSEVEEMLRSYIRIDGKPLKIGDVTVRQWKERLEFLRLQLRRHVQASEERIKMVEKLVHILESKSANTLSEVDNDDLARLIPNCERSLDDL